MAELNKKFSNAWIGLTYRCNNRCIWCYAASNTNLHRPIMPQENEDPSINIIYELGLRKVTLIGGEPTVHPRIYNIIEKIAKKGMLPGMVTNGRRFADKDFLRGIIDAGGASAGITVLGPNAKIHDSITKISGSFDETVRGLENSIKLGFNAGVLCTIAKANQNYLEGIVALAKNIGVKNVLFNCCGVCIDEEINNFNLMSPIEYANAFERVYLKSKELGIRTKLVTPLPICNFKPDLLERILSEQAVSKGCQLYSAGSAFMIDYNGDVLNCTHMAGHPLFNIFKDNTLTKESFLKKYLLGEESVYFREKIMHYPSTRCDSCQKCVGGCPLNWIKFNPDAYIKGPENLPSGIRQ